MRAALGPEPGDDEEVRILNRVVRWERDRITYEADEKHVHTVTNWVGLQPDSKGSEVPLTKDYDAEDEDQETDEGRLYRKLAATVNYLALDRPDLQFAANVLGRTMARPQRS